MKKILSGIILVTLLSGVLLTTQTGCGDDEVVVDTDSASVTITDASKTMTTESFSFKLTPTVMKQIRKYNKTTTYADFELTCTDYDKTGASGVAGYHCYSNFLACLASGGRTSYEAKGLKSCTTIFGSALTGADDNYNTFMDSMADLIRKQNALDEELIG